MMDTESAALNSTAAPTASAQCHLMLSKVSHEIRNPVTLINSFLQLLLTSHPDLADDCYYQKVQENMDFLKELLDELTSYNHSHTAQMEERNPYILLQDITANAASALEGSGITLELIKESAIPRIPLDISKFRQLCYNLIRNAAESMPGGGTIRILLSCDGAQVIIKFCDNGCGIPSEYLPTLFDLFVTHKKNGTGIGLAICQEIASAHGGEISVESEEGIGSVFTISLPLVFCS